MTSADEKLRTGATEPASPDVMHGSSRGRFGSDVTIDVVARVSGVSIRTVSRVLNRSVKVSDETRERVQAAIASLGFEPSLRARGLATGRSYLIGLVHNEHNALVLGEVQRGAVNIAAQRGYELIVHPTPLEDIDPIRDLLDFVKRSRVDGLLIMAPVSGVAGLAEALGRAGVVACAMSAIHLDGFTATVVYDERGGAAQAARHLISLGHRRIAMVSGPDYISSRERRAGFVEALNQAGLGLIGEAWGDYGFASGVAAGKELLALAPRPTAIFAANDIMAAGVIRVAAEQGISVPSELSVVGFDRSILAQMLTPALTSIDRPMSKIVHAAATQLIDSIEGIQSEGRVPSSLELVAGQSTAPIE